MPTNIEFAKQILTDVFNLKSTTVDKVIRQIQASGDTARIQTNSIRQNLGGQQFSRLQNSLNQSGEARGDYEEPRATEYDVDMDQEREAQEGDAQNQMDLEDEWSGDEEAPEMPGFEGTRDKLDALSIRKESIQFSLKDYLINEENMVNIDLSDPAAATAEVRKMSRIANNSPDRLRKQQLQDVRDERSEAQETEDATKPLRMQIANTKQRLVLLNKKLADIQRREGGIQ